MTYNEDDKKVYQTDLIHKSDAIEAVKEKLPTYMHGDVIRIINSIPIAKVKQKVIAKIHYDEDILKDKVMASLKEEFSQFDSKHGHWIWRLADNGWADHICSECGFTENTDIHVSLKWNYCPNCGVKMEYKDETNRPNKD